MNNSDTLVSSGGNIKTLKRSGDRITVGGYGIVWGSAGQRDLVGDWFTPSTYLGAHGGAGVDTMLHHGIPLKAELAAFADKLLPPTVTAEPDATGLLIATVLDLRDGYEKAIAEMVDAGLLSWSSGAPPHGVKRAGNAKAGEITRWLISEFSYTPTPCEPRLTGVMPLKALMAGAEIAGVVPIDNEIRSALEALTSPHVGLSFQDHAAAVRATAEGFSARLFDWYGTRAASRKVGRVFSAEKWDQLNAICVGLGSSYSLMRALLDEHQPGTTPDVMPAAGGAQGFPLGSAAPKSLEESILDAQIRFAEQTALMLGVSV